MAFFDDTTQYDAATSLADRSQGRYNRLGEQLGEQDAYMQRVARGEESVSAEQLRQSLAQNLSAQRSMAASASPQNSTMAALNASRQAMQLGSGAAGQQALAGIQERQSAQQQLTDALLRRRAQEQQTALQARQLAMASQPPSWMDRFGGAIQAGAQLAAMV